MDFQYNSYHTFEKDGLYCLFDNKNLISCIIDQRVHEALLSNSTKTLTQDEITILKSFRDQKIFFDKDASTIYELPKYDMVIISMALVHDCNMSCKYCFADSGENFKGILRSFSKKSLIAAIDFLLSNPYFSNINYYRINLVGGGEPLLNKNLFRMFVTTAFECFEKSGKHLYIWFATNGTLLTEEDLLFISQYNIGYGISIDGKKCDHDRLRIYKKGNGTYDDISTNIKLIQASPLVPKKLKELWGLMVYSKINSDIESNLKNLIELGFSSVQIRFIRTNDSALALDYDTIQGLAFFIKNIFEQAILGDVSLLQLISNDNDYIGKIIKRIVLRQPAASRCLAGSYMFSFAADGNIYPCDSFVGNPNFVIGSFYTDLNKEKMNEYKDLSVNVRPKCRTCWARFVCGGDCYHNSYLKHGNLLIPDELYCKTMVEIIEYVIAYTNKYRLKSREGYNSFCNFLLIRDRMSKK